MAVKKSPIPKSAVLIAAGEYEVKVRLPQLYAEQYEIKQHPARFKVLSAGRRFGKTILDLNLVAETIIGEGLPCGWFAPTYKVLDEAWLNITAALEPITVRSDSTKYLLEVLRNDGNAKGGVLECWSLENPDAGRSRKYARVIVDEAGLVPDLLESWNNAIEPTLADYYGDAFFSGTPKGRNGFYTLHQRGFDPLEPDWMSWQYASNVNPAPNIRLAYENARLHMPERTFRQEWNAEFLQDGGGVFRNIQELATITSGQFEYNPKHIYCGGMDWGRSGDYSVIAVFDATARRMVMLDRFTNVAYRPQRGRAAAACESWGLLTLLLETNSIGGPNLEALANIEDVGDIADEEFAKELAKDGLPVVGFNTSNQSKARLVDSFALVCERKAIALLKDKVLIDELESFEATRLPSGLVRYAAPQGQHDDCVMATLLAFNAAQSYWGQESTRRIQTAEERRREIENEEWRALLAKWTDGEDHGGDAWDGVPLEVGDRYEGEEYEVV